MQALYLIRHGEPDFREGRVCLGKTDIGLSEEGRRMSADNRAAIASIPDRHIASSPLKRCLESAEAAGCTEPEIRNGFAEIDMGLWDGLSFEVIKKKWPEEYEKRGLDIKAYAPPMGESFYTCRARAAREFAAYIKEQNTGNIIIFTHSGSGRMLAARLSGADIEEALGWDFPYGGCLQLLTDGERGLGGPVPAKFMTTPDDKTCFELYKEAGTPANVAAHCEAVAETAQKIAELLNENGFGLDIPFVRACALLHDIDRVQHSHAVKGAQRLLNAGYAAIASVTGDHMELPADEERISEKSLVFLADKLVRETSRVSLEERYFARTDPAKENFVKKRYKQAVRVFGMYEQAIPGITDI